MLFCIKKINSYQFSPVWRHTFVWGPWLNTHPFAVDLFQSIVSILQKVIRHSLCHTNFACTTLYNKYYLNMMQICLNGYQSNWFAFNKMPWDTLLTWETVSRDKQNWAKLIKQTGRVKGKTKETQSPVWKEQTLHLNVNLLQSRICCAKCGRERPNGSREKDF